MRFVAFLSFLLFPLITVARSQVSTEGQACLDCHSSSTPGRRYRTANDLPYPPTFRTGSVTAGTANAAATRPPAIAGDPTRWPALPRYPAADTPGGSKTSSRRLVAQPMLSRNDRSLSGLPRSRNAVCWGDHGGIADAARENTPLER